MLASERYTALLEALDSPDIDLADIAALKLVSVTRDKIGMRVICLTQDVLPAEVTSHLYDSACLHRTLRF